MIRIVWLVTYVARAFYDLFLRISVCELAIIQYEVLIHYPWLLPRKPSGTRASAPTHCTYHIYCSRRHFITMLHESRHPTTMLQRPPPFDWV